MRVRTPNVATGCAVMDRLAADRCGAGLPLQPGPDRTDRGAASRGAPRPRCAHRSATNAVRQDAVPPTAVPPTAGDSEPMPAPNQAYDPVEVAVLSPEELQRMQAEALAAIAGATDLDQLKVARLAHSGDRAPVTLANAEIGALPPAAR